MSDPDDMISLRQYAKHRGVSVNAVSLAIKQGRLRECVGRDEHGNPKILDADMADREWAAVTDLSKAQVAQVEAASAYAARQAAAAGEPVPDDDGDPAELGKGASLSEANRVEKIWKARTAELKFREAAGELVPARDVERRMADEFLSARTKLLGLPGRARQTLPHLTIADVAHLEALVREALEGLVAPISDSDKPKA